MQAANHPIRKNAGLSDAGRNCPYCRFAFKPGVELASCPACSASHHTECWSDNGGCAVVGCQGSPADGPAPPVGHTEPSAFPPPSQPTVGQSQPGGRTPLNAVALVCVGAAVAGLIAVLVALLVKGGEDGTVGAESKGNRSDEPAKDADGRRTAPTAPGRPRATVATVTRTCGATGTADCFVSLRRRPTSASPELDRLHERETVRLVCQRNGEEATASALGRSTRVWSRTSGGGYLTNAYLDGRGLNPFKITLQVCR